MKNEDVVKILVKEMTRISLSINHALCMENDLTDATAPLAVIILEDYAEAVRDIKPEYGDAADALRAVVKTAPSHFKMDKTRQMGAEDDGRP